jgi:hypothetical protein
LPAPQTLRYIQLKRQSAKIKNDRHRLGLKTQKMGLGDPKFWCLPMVAPT